MKELVIQLPDNYIDNIYTITNVTIRKAIINAQLLPEHGDLIDRNKLLKQPLDDANYPSNYVRMAPTILSATVDKEKNSEKVIGTNVCSLTDKVCIGKDCRICDINKQTAMEEDTIGKFVDVLFFGGEPATKEGESK